MTTSTRLVRKSAARRTSVGLKIVMATTGVLFLLFLLAHMYGNLKMLSGQAAFDGYAEHLRVIGEPVLPYAGFLWIMNTVLVLAVAGHIWAAVQLWRRANHARSTPYTTYHRVQATWSSRTMRWGGVTILLFVVFHLLQFTTVTIKVGGSFDSPYDRLVAAFSTWYIVAVYTLAMVALGMHLRHGTWSAVQTLGWSTQGRERAIKRTALAIALVIVVGFLLPPLAIFVGWVS
ncbi:MAG: succinate dehydrogenase cytochrome b subunit [Cellulomonas sp.]